MLQVNMYLRVDPKNHLDSLSQLANHASHPYQQRERAFLLFGSSEFWPSLARSQNLRLLHSLAGPGEEGGGSDAGITLGYRQVTGHFVRVHEYRSHFLLRLICGHAI